MTKLKVTDYIFSRVKRCERLRSIKYTKSNIGKILIHHCSVKLNIEGLMISMYLMNIKYKHRGINN